MSSEYYTGPTPEERAYTDRLTTFNGALDTAAGEASKKSTMSKRARQSLWTMMPSYGCSDINDWYNSGSNNDHPTLDAVTVVTDTHTDGQLFHHITVNYTRGGVSKSYKSGRILNDGRVEPSDAEGEWRFPPR
jgi:hypothetical protein